MAKAEKTCIIGCGNVLAGDDGIGVAVVRRLQEQGLLPPGVEVIEAGMPGLTLVEMMLDADKVVLVDALLGVEKPGAVLRYDENELPPLGYNAGQSHGIGLREALAFARQVMPDRFPGQVIVVGVTIERPLRWVEGLSPAVQAAVDRAVDMVLTEVG